MASRSKHRVERASDGVDGVQEDVPQERVEEEETQVGEEHQAEQDFGLELAQGGPDRDRLAWQWVIYISAGTEWGRGRTALGRPKIRRTWRQRRRSQAQGHPHVLLPLRRG